MDTEKQEFRDKITLALKTLKQYQNPSYKKAFIQLLNSFGPFILLWVAMYNLWDVSKTAVFGLAVLNAFFLVRIFIIQHDCGHNSFVKSRHMRNTVGYICSLFSAIPYSYWAKSHHFHHNHNGMLEVRDIGDLDTLTVTEYAALSRFKRFWYRVYRSPVVLFGLVPIYYILIHNRLLLVKLPEFKKLKWNLTINNIALIGGVALLCILLDWKKVLFVHFTTLGLFAIIAIWFFYIQHQHEYGYKHWRQRWEFIYAAVKGSSYYKLPGIFNWFTGNIAIHHIHHLNPAIPNYNLKKSVDAIPWINKYTTEISFIQSLKLATHKLWDEQNERMITFREYYQMEKNGLLSQA
ncbi:MAG: fatty acid desaturase [Saprospiraceae bacterium]|nr:fatty acid desaturase [Saprospiraceae bacterium]